MNCPCYPDCEILPDGRCLGQACIELVLREKEKVFGRKPDKGMAEQDRRKG